MVYLTWDRDQCSDESNQPQYQPAATGSTIDTVAWTQNNTRHHPDVHNSFPEPTFSTGSLWALTNQGKVNTLYVWLDSNGMPGKHQQTWKNMEFHSKKHNQYFSMSMRFNFLTRMTPHLMKIDFWCLDQAIVFGFWLYVFVLGEMENWFESYLLVKRQSLKPNSTMPKIYEKRIRSINAQIQEKSICG